MGPLRHPEFLDAITRARDLALAWWGRQGVENIGNRDYNANLYRVIMMARFGQDGYREKQVIETVHGGSGIDLRLLTPAEREVLAVLLTKAIPQPDGPATASRVAEAEKPSESEPGSTDRGSVH
jgi:hypothetical protein